MSFDKRDNARIYTPQDGDTLQTIADRETAAGNELTWQEIAKFNWGTDDLDEVNEYMRDELGCYRRDESNNFVISSDDDPRSDLLIPVPFEQSGFALGTTHTLRIQKQESPQQFLECSSIPGVTFEFDKSFVRPSVVDNIGELEERLERHSDAKIMIFGHTDKSGSDPYNKGLSERRAKSVYAFITDDPDVWETLYNQERWGMSVLQQILQDFGDPYDPGRTDGVKDERTTQAIRQYQGDRGLTVDGVAGPTTRREMFTEYMTDKHDVELTPDQFMDPKHMGCGEFNPIDPVDGPHEPNRRVTFYLFDESRLPNLPCEEGKLGRARGK
ncbi:peptidoglycan-binding protein [Candidatus Poribacteria bacterium]